MKSLLLVILALVVVAPNADAAPKKKKYHFELTKVLAKPEVKADVAKEAQPRIEAVFKKALESNPQLVLKVDGAPDPDANAAAYRKFLTKKGISGAYLVTVEVTEASIEVVPLEEKKNTQRISVTVGLHVLGETIPGRTMGFTGDGRATVKQEVGMKIRDKERQFTWDSAAETAVENALKECFAKLALPPKKQ
ncbi:MAG TPA: hypothetical protein VIV11_30930 [Kofleriaceae bacterium]